MTPHQTPVLPQNLLQNPPQNLPLIHQALEARFASRLAHALTESSAALPHNLNERLRVARDQALARARTARKLQAAAATSGTGGGTAVLRGGPGAWSGLPEWLSALMPLAVLLVGLLLISQLNVREQIRVAADIDTQLLADDLPPSAYADPGFVQYLRRGPAQ